MTPLPENITMPEGERKSLPPHTFLRSNVNFEQGVISWEAFLVDGQSICNLLLPAEPGPAQSTGTAAEPSAGPSTEYELAFGLNSLGAPYGFALLRNGNWEPVVGAGHGSAVPTNRWITVSVRAFGSIIDMYVDGVRVLSTTRTLRRGQVAYSCKAQNRSSLEFAG